MKLFLVYLLCVRKRPGLGLCQSTVCKTHRTLFSNCEQVRTHFVKCFSSFTLLRNKLLVSFGEVGEYDTSLKHSESLTELPGVRRPRACSQILTGPGICPLHNNTCMKIPILGKRTYLLRSLMQDLNGNSI